MGKIFNALERYRKEKQHAPKARVPEMIQADWDVLMQFNRQTGKLNLHDSQIIKDPGTIHRLLGNQMIFPDGRLTHTGKRECEALRNEMRSSLTGHHGNQVVSQEDVRKIEKVAQEIETEIQVGMLSDSDLKVLMSYDRTTGHLLNYGKDTGNLDSSSLEFVRDQGVLRRLLSAKIIDPGGKLTPLGKKTCAGLSHKIKIPAAEMAVLVDLENDSRQNGKVSKPAEKMKASDWAALMLYDKDTGNLIKYNHDTGKLDDRSRTILRDPEAIQRLIDNNMILPGGWLTREAKLECEKREHGYQKPVGKKKAKEIKRENKVIERETIDIIEETRLLESRPKAAAHQGVKQKTRVITEGVSEPEKKVVKVNRKANKAGANGHEFVTLVDPLSFEAEQFKILRTNILFPVSGKAPRSILVTSTLPGEGKSFVASNLAVAIANDVDRHVLLVDCDLRRPSIHKQFGYNDVPGLSEYLANGAALPDLLVNTDVVKLSILPAGKPPDNPAELLSSERMSALIAEITDRYRDRMIIFDSPPPKLTAESSFLARQVDGILLVVNYGKTQRADVKELIETMGKDKILGSIMNNFDMRSLGYSRYKKYRKFGHYYKK